MRVRKPIRYALGAVVLLCGGLAFFIWYEASHFRIELSNEQLSNARTALEGTIGQTILFPKQNEDLSKGLIYAYKKNPQEFKRYAQMVDTALNAERVGKAALSLAPSEVPSSSSQLRMDPSKKVDSWGKPFCIIPLAGRLAVVSGGPSKKPCDSLPLTVEQLNRSERTIFAGPSESVIVIVAKKQQEISHSQTSSE